MADLFGTPILPGLDYREQFLAEAEENLAELEDALLSLEATPGHAETLNTVFRAAHTLKGASASLSALRATRACAEIERAAKTNGLGLSELAKSLKLELRSAHASMRALLDSLA